MIIILFDIKHLFVHNLDGVIYYYLNSTGEAYQVSGSI